MLRHIRFADIPPQPWRNGGGETREVAVFHDPTLHPDFLWRVSLATVQQAGPFSHFEGVDRSIAVLQGGGMQLSSPEGTRALGVGDEPFCFPGEQAITASLTDGATTDLNIMTRRAFFRHHLQCIADDTTLKVEADAAVLVVRDATTTKVGATVFDTNALDCITGLTRGDLVQLKGQAYLANIWRL